jgi:hypothetical protein
MTADKENAPANTPFARTNTSSKRITNVRSNKVKVSVRVKGPVEDDGGIWRMEENKKTIAADGMETAMPVGASTPTRRANYRFEFDRVYGATETTAEIFNDSVKEMVAEVITGYNATVFSYGQTGSGKTYTTIGTTAAPGLIFYCVNEIFERVNEMRDNGDFLIWMSCIEVYDGDARDMLAEAPKPADMGKEAICEVSSFSDASLQRRYVSRPDEVFQLVKQADSKRHVGAHKLNDRSSRSHFIFRLNVEARLNGKGGDELKGSEVISGALTMIDLAGSENAKATEAEGQTLKEGCRINKDLSVLGRVVYALGNPRNKGPDHIPWRESRLTSLLKPCLSPDNAHTLFVCTISNKFEHFGNALDTLRFGCTANKIEIRPTINRIPPKESIISANPEEVQRLSNQLALMAKQVEREKEARLKAEKEKKNALKQLESQEEQADKLLEFINNKALAPVDAPIDPVPSRPRPSRRVTYSPPRAASKILKQKEGSEEVDEVIEQIHRGGLTLLQQQQEFFQEQLKKEKEQNEEMQRKLDEYSRSRQAASIGEEPDGVQDENDSSDSDQSTATVKVEQKQRRRKTSLEQELQTKRAELQQARSAPASDGSEDDDEDAAASAAWRRHRAPSAEWHAAEKAQSELEERVRELTAKPDATPEHWGGRSSVVMAREDSVEPGGDDEMFRFDSPGDEETDEAIQARLDAKMQASMLNTTASPEQIELEVEASSALDATVDENSLTLSIAQTVKLTAAAEAGASKLEVDSHEGFSVGDHISIFDPSTDNRESNIISGFGSMLLHAPLQQSFAIGTQVSKLPAVTQSKAPASALEAALPTMTTPRLSVQHLLNDQNETPAAGVGKGMGLAPDELTDRRTSEDISAAEPSEILHSDEFQVNMAFLKMDLPMPSSLKSKNIDPSLVDPSEFLSDTDAPYTKMQDRDSVGTERTDEDEDEHFHLKSGLPTAEEQIAANLGISKLGNLQQSQASSVNSTAPLEVVMEEGSARDRASVGDLTERTNHAIERMQMQVKNLKSSFRARDDSASGQNDGREDELGEQPHQGPAVDQFDPENWGKKKSALKKCGGLHPSLLVFIFGFMCPPVWLGGLFYFKSFEAEARKWGRLSIGAFACVMVVVVGVAAVVGAKGSSESAPSAPQRELVEETSLPGQRLLITFDGGVEEESWGPSHLVTLRKGIAALLRIDVDRVQANVLAGSILCEVSIAGEDGTRLADALISAQKATQAHHAIVVQETSEMQIAGEIHVCEAYLAGQAASSRTRLYCGQHSSNRRRGANSGSDSERLQA